MLHNMPATIMVGILHEPCSLPNQPNSNCTPFMADTYGVTIKVKLDLSKLHVFGCGAYVFLPEEGQS